MFEMSELLYRAKYIHSYALLENFIHNYALLGNLHGHNCFFKLMHTKKKLAKGKSISQYTVNGSVLAKQICATDFRECLLDS